MTLGLLLPTLILLLLLSGPAVAFLHELGHAGAGRLLGGGPVQVFVGSYGDAAGSFKLPLGPHSRLYIFRNPLQWSRGLCQFREALHGYRAILMLLAGPLLPWGCAVGLVWVVFHTATNDLVRLWSVALVVGAGVSLLVNLLNDPKPLPTAGGSVTYNDGAQLRLMWYYRLLPRAYMLAVAEYQSGNFAAAAPALMPYLTARSYQENTIRMVVSALIQLDDYAQARQVLDQYRSCCSPITHDLVNEGLIRAHFGELAAALACFEQALELDPTNSYAFNNRGYTRNRAGQYAEAVPDFRRALELNPGFAYSHANLGLALLMLGETDEGLGHIRYSLRLDDANSYAYRNLGIYHLQRGELDQARQQFDRAWELNPATDLLADYRGQLQAHLDKQVSNQ
ncbi:tetratricopeptide repeat protein [Hymenobacter metallicola]|uniref:Tetratricopeptide repeat protein n=1 Tax=Hymenobacter metallicola TaxID=2563114 RepID=A0A4Z0QGQ7_9BACT|nr:tetratricopeptide repeat protein [Hymenobacter metallicola]TGE28914.1 tetratricopeptide repeat protein [Hymenobacter metallicola]